MQISAIVCTHNQAGILKRCLDALAAQSLHPEQYEVIIVDNASTDATRAIAEEWCAVHRVGRYIREDRLGLTVARNVGLAACASPVVAYTDDDAVVNPDWLAKYVEAAGQLPEDVVGFGGELDPAWSAPPPDWLKGGLLQLLSVALRWSEEPRLLGAGEWICEANCAYRTEVLKRYGGFPEKLGRVGELLLSGENFVNDMMAQDGLKFYFDPTNRVTHHIHPDRVSKAWLRRRAFWAGVTNAILPAAAQERGYDHARWPSVMVPTSPSDWVELLDDDASTDFALVCSKVEQLGYLLGTAKVISSR